MVFTIVFTIATGVPQDITTLKRLEREALIAPQKDKPKLYQNLFSLFRDVDKGKALIYADSSLYYAELLKDTAFKYEMMETTGLYHNLNGSTESGYKQLFEALVYFSSVNDPVRMAGVINAIGLSSFYGGYYTEALDYFNRALQLRKKHKLHKSIPLTINNVGLVYLNTKQYKEALPIFLETYDLKLKQGLKESAVRSLINIGTTYMHLGMHDASVRALEQALHDSKMIEYHGGIPVANAELANTYTELGRFQEAEALLKQVHHDYEKMNAPFGLIDVEQYLSRMHYKQGNLQMAVLHQQRAAAYAKKVVALARLRDCYATISELYEKQGNLAGAFQYSRLVDEVNTQRRNQEVHKEFSELNANITLAKQEREIELLEKEKQLQTLRLEQLNTERLFLTTISIGGFIFLLVFFARYRVISRLKKALEEKNVQIQQQKDSLAAINSSKDKFFSLLAHDLRSPFHATLAMSDLLMEDVETLTTEEIKRFSSTIHLALKRQYLHLEDVLTWSRLQINRFEINKMAMDIDSVLSHATEVLSSNADAKGISFLVTNNIEDVIVADKNVVGTVLHNLIGNAIKYSRRGDTIMIAADIQEGDVIITVEDQGVGIPKEKLKRLFNIAHVKSTPGTEQEQGTGLGLVICKDMMGKMGGSIEAESEPGMGSRFTLRFPWETEAVSSVSGLRTQVYR